MNTNHSAPIEEESEAFSEIGLKRLLLFADVLLLAAFIACVIVFFVRLSQRSSGSVPDSYTAVQAEPSGAESTAELEGEDVPYQAPATPAGPPATLAETSGAKENINVAALQQQGESIVGWIYCPGTSIEYPIVQGEDNEYYMDHNREGRKDSAGAIYLDCRNDSSYSDEQIMIYGNLMSDGTMFSPLVQYLNQAFFDSHPIFELYTAAGKYILYIYAAHRGSPAMSNYPIWFMDAAARDNFVAGEKASSAIKSAVQVKDTDQLVALVTSSDFDAGEDARVIVRAALRPAS